LLYLMYLIQLRDYDRYLGKVEFVNAPALNSVITISYKKECCDARRSR